MTNRFMAKRKSLTAIESKSGITSHLTELSHLMDHLNFVTFRIIATLLCECGNFLEEGVTQMLLIVIQMIGIVEADLKLNAVTT